jgi:hypothetical protein
MDARDAVLGVCLLMAGVLVGVGLSLGVLLWGMAVGAGS